MSLLTAALRFPFLKQAPLCTSVASDLFPGNGPLVSGTDFLCEAMGCKADEALLLEEVDLLRRSLAFVALISCLKKDVSPVLEDSPVPLY